VLGGPAPEFSGDLFQANLFFFNSMNLLGVAGHMNTPADAVAMEV
jgi:hypothetical protein